MRTSIAFFALAALALVPIVASGQPSITIYTDAGTYGSGSTIEVSLSAQNDGDGLSVDVYVGLLAPDGSIYCINPSGWLEGIVPWISDIYVPSLFEMGRTSFWWIAIPSVMPPIATDGDYNFAALLTRAGTQDWVSDLSVAPFGVLVWGAPSGIIVSVAPNPAIQEEDTIVFMGMGEDDDGEVVAYEWSSDVDGILSTNNVFTRDASDMSLGFHTISFRVRDNNGFWSEPDVLAVQIQRRPLAVIDSVTPNPAVHDEDIVEFTGHAVETDAIVTGFKWECEGIGRLSTEPEFWADADRFSVGDHTISFSVMDAFSLWSKPVTATLSIISPPKAHIDFIRPNPAMRGKDTVEFIGSGVDTDGEVVAYEWRSDLDGTLSTDREFAVAAGSLFAGVHNIWLRVQDDSGLWSDMASARLTVATFDLHVDAEHGDDGNDGSEAFPFKTITHGLASATASENSPGIIRVAAGAYAPLSNGEPFPLNMVDYVSMVGAGSESTIIDAGHGASHVIMCAAEGVTIDGFRISGGNADGIIGTSDARGGGICLYSDFATIRNNMIAGNSAAEAGGGVFVGWGTLSQATPTLEDNTITYNTAGLDGGGVGCENSCPVIKGNKITMNQAHIDSGGGIHCLNSECRIENNTVVMNMAGPFGGGVYYEGGSLSVEGNTVSRNASLDGAGIYCRDTSGILDGNTLSENQASGDGGGIYCFVSTPTIKNSTIANNSAQCGAGVYCTNPVEPTAGPNIKDNTIESNTAEDGGGGIYGTVSTPTVRGNSVLGNSAIDGGGICFSATCPVICGNSVLSNSATGDGGGIYCGQSSPTIDDNTIGDFDSGNAAGGFGGGILCCSCSTSILNNAIRANSSSEGAGIDCCDCKATIWNNIIIANNGDGIRSHTGWDIIRNNTVAFNALATDGHGILCTFGMAEVVDCIVWGNGDDLDLEIDMGSLATYCCIEDLDSGKGNIHDDPLFVGGPLGAYYLDPDSPCVDTGSQSAAAAGLALRTTRADGALDANTVDMGYHYPLP